MDKVVYQNQNKGKLFKNNSGGSVQTELAATGNIFDANQNKRKRTKEKPGHWDM